MKCNHAHKITANTVLKGDPTRTLTIRKAFERDAVRRFTEIKRLITTSVVTNDCFGLNNPPPTISVRVVSNQEPLPPNAFQFRTTGQKIEGFMAWLDRVESETTLEIVTRPGIRKGSLESAWSDIYIKRGYEAGIRHGNQRLRKAGFPNIPVYDSQAVQVAINTPFHADRVGILYTRTFNGLVGITDEMDKQISEVLAEGLLSGDNPRDIAKALNNRVDKIGITRARTLARTEVVRAHHVASIQEYKNWGVVGVEVEAEWGTAGFNVCPICLPLEGRVYTLDEIGPLIPRHPNCRCTAIPVKPDEEN